MAYFQDRQGPQEEEEYQPVFQDSAGGYQLDDYADDGDEMEFYDENEEYLTEEDKQWRRQSKWRVLAGLGDFLGVIAGTVVILILIALLISLIHWVQADIRQSFTLWQTKM